MMKNINKIIFVGMFLLVLLSTVSAYEITHRFYNETTVVTHYSDILNKNFTWRIESEQLFDECKRGIGKSYINCSVGDYNAYIRSRVNLIEEGEIERVNTSQITNPTHDSDLLDRIFKLELEVSYLMSILNITAPEPEASPLFTCESREPAECPGGLSSINKDGIQTRCYNIFKIGWKNCATGWN